MGQVDPLLIEPLPILRDAYVQDLIDLETYEYFVELYLSGNAMTFPASVMALAEHKRTMMMMTTTDAPGAIFPYHLDKRLP